MSDIYFLENTNKDFIDLYLCYCGMEQCAPLYSFGPAIRPNYLLHYVLDGKGYYYVNNEKYEVNKNEGFLICPNVVTFYQADEENPWTYLWIGIDGEKVETYLKAAGLNNDTLIFKYNDGDLLKEYILEMLKHNTSSSSDSLKIEGVTIFEWLESLPTTDCRRLWESTICDLYNHIGGHNEYILTGQLVGFANYFVCSLQHLFFVVFYIVGQSDCLSPDAFLKLLDNYVFQKQ